MVGKYQFPTALLGLGSGHPIGPVVYPLILDLWKVGYWVSDEGTGEVESGGVAVGILKAQDKCSVNYGIISLAINIWLFWFSCQLNISPRFRAGFR